MTIKNRKDKCAMVSQWNIAKFHKDSIRQQLQNLEEKI